MVQMGDHRTDGASDAQVPLLEGLRQDEERAGWEEEEDGEQQVVEDELGDRQGQESEEDRATNSSYGTPGGIFNLKPSVWTLLPAPFLMLLGNILLVTMMPTITASWFTKCANGTNVTGTGSAACKPDFETAQSWTGMIDSLRNLLSFFSAALIGRLSDVYGRRPIYMMGIVVSNLPLLSLYLTNAESSTAYYATCIFAGILGCGLRGYLGVVSMAFISDTTPQKKIPIHIGIYSAIMTLGMIINPLVGSFVQNLSVHDILSFNLFMALLSLLYVIFVLPESLPLSRRNSFEWGRTMNPLAPLHLLAQSPVMRAVGLVYFLGSAAESGVGEIALIYVDQVLGLSGSASMNFNRTLMSVIGISMLLSNTFLLRGLLRLKLSPTTLMLLAMLGNAVHIGTYVILGFYPHKITIYLNSIPTAFLTLMSVSANTIIAKTMGEQEQGFALGTLAAMSGIGGVISPMLFSELFAYYGHHYDLPEVPFLFGFAFALAAFFLTLCGPLQRLDGHKPLNAPSHSIVHQRQNNE